MRRQVVTVVAAALALLAAEVTPALADNCGTPSDCFGAAGSFNVAAIGLLALAGLSLVLDFVPVLGTAKGVVEAATGRDLLTGQELSWPERALGVLPVVGGLAAVAGVARAARAADTVAAVSRTADRVGDLSGLRRGFDTADHPHLRDLPRKSTPNRTAADRFEIEHTGPDNFRFRDGDEQVWVDGYRASERAVLDAKYVGNPRSSPFVEGSDIPPAIRQKILVKIEDEFRRYAAVVKDPDTVPEMLEVIVNSENARPFFEGLLTKYGIPDRLVVVP